MRPQLFSDKRRLSGSGTQHAGVAAAERGAEENLDLLVVALLSLVVGSLGAFAPAALAFARIPLSLAFLLLAPGYALMAALFPQAGAIDGDDRLALTLGLSVIAVPLLGLLFNYLPWGIRLAPMSLGLTALILLALLLALYRRRQLEPGRRFVCRTGSLGCYSVLLILALVLPGLVIVSAQALRPPQQATEFYLLGTGGRLEGFPHALKPGQQFTLRVGVRNYDNAPVRYRIDIPLAARPTRVIELARGEVWERELVLTAPRGQGRTPLGFYLYRPGQATPYRSLELFVTLTTVWQKPLPAAQRPG